MVVANPHDPFHPPDARYRRCVSLVDRAERPTPEDDEPTVRGWQYLVDLSNCQDDEQRDQLAIDHPALHAAHTLRARDGDLRRMGVEGYLLAGVLPEEIDERFELLPGTVHCYGQQFFDVADRLGAPDHIINVVIGLHSRELTEEDAGVFLMLFGYLGGRHVVDAVLDYFYAPLWLPLLMKRVTGEELYRLRQRLQVRLVILTECLRVRSSSLRQWAALNVLIRRAEQRRRGEWSGLRVPLSGLLPVGATAAETA